MMNRKTSSGLCIFVLIAVSLFSSLSSGENLQSPTLEIFACGVMEFDDIGSFSDTGEFDGREWSLVVPCFLVRHPGGLLIWDVGVSAAMISSSEDAAAGIRATLAKSLADGLAESGVAVSDIDLIAMSHMHPDHSGSANMFAGSATWLTSKTQFDFAFSDASAAIGFDQSTYNDLKHGPKELIEDEHDVFGDGTVVIYATPGHTPGHQVLFVDLKEYGPVILSGDLHVTRESREKRLVPSFNVDREATLASIDRVEALLSARDAKLIIQHSPADYESLPHAPDVLK